MEMHKLAADLVMNKMKYTDIGELNAAGNNNQRAINRAYLQKVIQNVVFLARQGLPFRGNWQDELIKLLAHSHLCRIAAGMKAAGYFALEADEVMDSSNKEQVVVCIRLMISSKYMNIL